MELPDPEAMVEAWQGYDGYAARYDALLEENWINAYMRSRSLSALESTFPAASHLLELGCGTGDEALAMARRGVRVLAIDPAPGMIALARRKAKERREGVRVEFRVAAAHDLDRVLSDTPSVDGAYASFALSYEPDLNPVAHALARTIRPPGVLLFSVMNRLCATELLMSMLAVKPGLAGRRLRSLTLHKVGDYQVPIYPRTALEVTRAFEPTFQLERLHSLPLLIPPHYMNRFLRRWPRLFHLLTSADPLVSSIPVVRHLGDHLLLWFRRS